MSLKILKSTYLEKNPAFLNVRKDTLQFENGHIIDGYIVNESRNWVNAVVLTKESNLILVKQYRHGVREEILEILAGAVEEGESSEDAIIREVKEETGYVSNEKPIFLGEHYVNPANFTNSIRSYLILNAEKQEEQQLDLSEEIMVQEYPFKNIDTLIKSGELKQLFSINAILIAQKRLNKEKGENEYD